MSSRCHLGQARDFAHLPGARWPSLLLRARVSVSCAKREDARKGRRAVICLGACQSVLARQTASLDDERGALGRPSVLAFVGSGDQPMKSTPLAGRLLTGMVRVVGVLMPFQFCSETTNDVGVTLST